jgi:hypothetical protein
VWQEELPASSPILIVFDVVNHLTGVFLLISFLSKKNNRDNQTAFFKKNI